MLKDAALTWAAKRAPVAAYRTLRDRGSTLGYDPATYAEIADMGWTGVIIPEAYGGAALGSSGLGIVLEQLGRTLVASPLVSSALAAASALLLGGSEAQRTRWLAPIAAGAAVATLALDEAGRHAPLETALCAAPADGGWRLTGDKRPVLHGMGAHLAIVAARTAGRPGEAGGITLFLVDTASHGLKRSPLLEIEARGAAAYAFEQVPVNADAVLGCVGEGAPLLEQVLDRARAGVAAEMLGGALHAFEMTLEHLKARVQFGRPIGSFQALQHRAAGLYGELELTRSAVGAALDAIDADRSDTAELASLAKALAGGTFRRVAAEMVQLHGGIGMTDEHDAGLYLKRARAADMSYGSAAFHRERYGMLTGF
jgi:alkylation response protein AidB-like acyl-CoA dehydrogenase